MRSHRPDIVEKLPEDIEVQLRHDGQTRGASVDSDRWAEPRREQHDQPVVPAAPQCPGEVDASDVGQALIQDYSGWSLVRDEPHRLGAGCRVHDFPPIKLQTKANDVSKPGVVVHHHSHWSLVGHVTFVLQRVEGQSPRRGLVAEMARRD